MVGSLSGHLSKTWCALHLTACHCLPDCWVGVDSPLCPAARSQCMHLTSFQAALLATVGAKEMAQKDSVSERTSVHHNACSVIDASANSTCTCEEDCLGGCDTCEKELHKKKMQRVEARHHICLCSNDNKHRESWSDEPCGGNILICIGPTRDGERCERALCVRHFRALDEGGNRHGSLCSQCHGWACSQCIRVCSAYTSWHTCAHAEHPAELCPRCV